MLIHSLFQPPPLICNSPTSFQATLIIAIVAAICVIVPRLYPWLHSFCISAFVVAGLLILYAFHSPNAKTLIFYLAGPSIL